MKSTTLSLLIVICMSLYLFSCQGGSHENGKSVPDEADQVARAIEAAINKEAWDATEWVHWVYPGPREYLWDRERGFVEVQWAGYRALVDIKSRKGKVYQEGKPVDEMVLDSLLTKAWISFINDAFWLNAPAKLFDDGTIRSLVERDGNTFLQVKYTTGGVTPGDHYIWHYDANFLPTAFEMYVSVISEPGRLATWEKWITLESGARIAPSHQTGERSWEIKEIKSGDTYQDFGRNEDPFHVLVGAVH